MLSKCKYAQEIYNLKEHFIHKEYIVKLFIIRSEPFPNSMHRPNPIKLVVPETKWSIQSHDVS